MLPKDVERIANSVDPDQTAQTYMSQYLEFLRYYCSRLVIYSENHGACSDSHKFCFSKKTVGIEKKNTWL